MRLHKGKQDCLILDYAENIERHKLQENLFKPDISISKKTGDTESVLVICPQCEHHNYFSKTDKMPEGHAGQRCQNMLPVKQFPKDKSDFMQCTILNTIDKFI